MWVFFYKFSEFLKEKDQNIHLNDNLPLKIANSSQKQKFPGNEVTKFHIFSMRAHHIETYQLSSATCFSFHNSLVLCKFFNDYFLPALVFRPITSKKMICLSWVVTWDVSLQTIQIPSLTSKSKFWKEKDVVDNNWLVHPCHGSHMWPSMSNPV